MASTTPYPLRLSDEQREEIKKTALLVSLPFPETMRLAIKFGLPIVEEKMKKS